MRLYLCRHGQAQSMAASDALRSLTGEGEKEVTALWDRLHAAGISPRRVVSSPYLRAQQTARLAAAQCAAVDQVSETELLVPDASPAALIDWLHSQPDPDGLLLVTHMPLIALLTSMLAGAQGDGLAFPTGAVVALDMDVVARGCATLVWLRAPGESF